MENRSFFEETGKNEKINIIKLDFENEKFKLIENVTIEEGKKHFSNDEYCEQIENFGFSKILALAQAGNFEEIKRIISDNDGYFEWEEYYTDSEKDEDLVDLIGIHTESKCFMLFLNEGTEITDGYTELGCQSLAEYVSRDVFDALIEGLKLKGYKEEKDA